MLGSHSVIPQANTRKPALQAGLIVKGESVDGSYILNLLW